MELKDSGDFVVREIDASVSAGDRKQEARARALGPALQLRFRDVVRDLQIAVSPCRVRRIDVRAEARLERQQRLELIGVHVRVWGYVEREVWERNAQLIRSQDQTHGSKAEGTYI